MDTKHIAHLLKIGVVLFSGNLIADSLVHQNLLHADSIAGTHVFISLVNSGSIRSSMDRGKDLIKYSNESGILNYELG